MTEQEIVKSEEETERKEPRPRCGGGKRTLTDTAATLLFIAAVLAALFAIAFGSMLPVLSGSGSTQTFFEVVHAVIDGHGESDLEKVAGIFYGGCVACIAVSAVCFIAGACLKLIPPIKECRKK